MTCTPSMLHDNDCRQFIVDCLAIKIKELYPSAKNEEIKIVIDEYLEQAQQKTVHIRKLPPHQKCQVSLISLSDSIEQAEFNERQLGWYIPNILAASYEQRDQIKAGAFTYKEFFDHPVTNRLPTLH